ncbi:unnamed protein product, partial [marine sediment metagenome]
GQGSTAPDWLALWAFGRLDLNLAIEEFWGLTPRQLEVLQERQTEREEEMDYRASLIAAVVMNVNRTKRTQKTTQPHDLIPRRSQQDGLRQPTKMTVERMMMHARQWTALLGGTITEVN